MWVDITGNVLFLHMLCDGVFPRRGIDASLAIKLFKREILYPVIKMASENYRYLFAEDTAVLYPYLLRAESIFVMKECFYYHRQYENKQKKYYEDYVKQREGWDLIEIYADEGISATSIKRRKDFIRMLDDCKAGRITRIITKSVSRFGRNVVDTIATVRSLRNLPTPVGVFLKRRELTL